MTTIDRVLLPFSLFLIYYGIALWCLHQPSNSLAATSTALAAEIFSHLPSASTVSPVEISSHFNDDLKEVMPQIDCQIDRAWLETQSHKNLKAIASEFSIEVVDKRSKRNYILAILARPAGIGAIDDTLLRSSSGRSKPYLMASMS
jgi:hypothetical protein